MEGVRETLRLGDRDPGKDVDGDFLEVQSNVWEPLRKRAFGYPFKKLRRPVVGASERSASSIGDRWES